jgi:peptide-methionine (S)-S-oxide reductase
MKLLLSTISLIFFSCHSQEQKNLYLEISEPIPMDVEHGLSLATFAGGCFWCTEAVFLEIKGVKKIIPGFTGGIIKNPAYREVTTGRTGHAEAIQITFNPEEVSYEDLLEIFFATHDPTTLNRQGNDVGTHYRSEIFFHNDEQKEKANAYLAALTDEKVFSSPIVTRITPASEFYEAEDYHVNYYRQNTSQPYCQYVISPKVDKVRKLFKDKLKK